MPKKIKSQKQLNVHLWRHLGIILCGNCDRKFSFLADMNKHEENCHSNISDDIPDKAKGDINSSVTSVRRVSASKQA